MSFYRRVARVLPALLLLIMALPPAGFAQAISNVWTSHTPSHTPRTEGAAVVHEGKLYSLAGFARDVRATHLSEVYDPETDSWSLLAPIPRAVTHVGAVLVGDEAWIVGGFEGDHPGPALDVVQIYHIPTNTWRFGPSLPIPRASGTLALLGRRLHHVGGLLPDRDTDVGDHFVLDLDDPEAGWSTLAPLPNPRNHLSSAVLDGKLYVIGGQMGHDEGRRLSALVHIYDPETDSWSRAANLPLRRSHAEMSTLIHNGRIVVAGGVGPGPRRSASLDLVTAYDPETNTWSEIGTLPEPLLGSGARIIGDRLYVANGSIGPSGNAQSSIWSVPVEPVATSTGPQPGRPAMYGLEPNYPNPFDERTRIRFALPRTSPTRLSVYDLLGRRVAVVVDQVMVAGVHEVEFDGSAVPSGTYLFRFRADGFRATRTMHLLRR